MRMPLAMDETRRFPYFCCDARYSQKVLPPVINHGIPVKVLHRVSQPGILRKNTARRLVRGLDILACRPRPPPSQLAAPTQQHNTQPKKKKKHNQPEQRREKRKQIRLLALPWSDLAPGVH